MPVLWGTAKRRGRGGCRTKPVRASQRAREAKQHRVERTDDIYPQGVPPRRCEPAREQCAWRLEEGRAIYVRYRIFRERSCQELPHVFGLRNSRCEFGLEIHVVLAFLVYHIGLSMDQARAILAFFTRLELSRSQADALLNQLAADRQEDFDALCQLVAVAAVLCIDESGWKVGRWPAGTRQGFCGFAPHCPTRGPVQHEPRRSEQASAGRPVHPCRSRRAGVLPLDAGGPAPAMAPDSLLAEGGKFSEKPRFGDSPNVCKRGSGTI